MSWKLPRLPKLPKVDKDLVKQIGKAAEVIKVVAEVVVQGLTKPSKRL